MKVYPGRAGYGAGAGHYQDEIQRYRGKNTVLVGVGVCCCTCCPCGFCLPLDSKTIKVWITDSPAGQLIGSGSAGGMVPAAVKPVQASMASPLVNAQCGRCGSRCRVQAPQEGGITQFTCPSCGASNQIEVPRPAGEEAPLPKWWKVSPAANEFKLQSASDDIIQLMQSLLDDTWRDVTTRDRGFTIPPKLKVVMVQQNYNSRMWRNYALTRERVQSGMQHNSARTECKTNRAIEAGGADFVEAIGPLEAGANEFMLFHGSKPSAVQNICADGFQVRLAGSNTGTLYGPGIYFAENSSKSDEYASDDDNGIYQGLYAMLLCRVACGRMLYTDEVAPDTRRLTEECVSRKRFDSVLGDREKAKGTYREFVVFDGSQVYPEFVIIYRRE